MRNIGARQQSFRDNLLIDCIIIVFNLFLDLSVFVSVLPFIYFFDFFFMFFVFTLWLIHFAAPPFCCPFYDINKCDTGKEIHGFFLS